MKIALSLLSVLLGSSAALAHDPARDIDAHIKAASPLAPAANPAAPKDDDSHGFIMAKEKATETLNLEFELSPLSAEDSYKKYSQIYCGKDAVDAACQAKYADNYGPFEARLAEVCKSDAGWLKHFGEECKVLQSRTDGAAPSLRTADQWAELGKPDRYRMLLNQEARDLNAFQRGYDAALRLNETLRKEYLPKKDFEGALKRRTEGMLPDYGTKKDNKLRAINVIYVYLGLEAKDFLVGADGKSGKLGFLNDLGKVKDFEKLRDEEKYLSESARKGLADQKAASAQGKKAGDQAKKTAEELKKGLKQQVEGFAKGAASEGEAPVAAGAAAPFWSGAPRSAEQVALAASQSKRRQLPKSLNTKSSEPPAVEGDKPEKKRRTFEGCRSFLGWKCAVRALQIGADHAVDFAKKVKDKGLSFGKKAGHEAKEAVMIGKRTPEDEAKHQAENAARKTAKTDKAAGPADPIDPADPAAPAAPAPVDQAAALASIQKWTTEAIKLADSASTKAKSATARAVKAAAGKDPDAVAAQAAASAAGEEALKHAAEANEQARAAIAAGPTPEGTDAKNLANAAAIRAEVAARRALSSADAAEAAAAKQAATPLVVTFPWGRELKSRVTGNIIEANWTAGKGSYIKVLGDSPHITVDPSGSYFFAAGSKIEVGVDGAPKRCMVAPVGGQVFQRTTSGPVIPMIRPPLLGLTDCEAKK